jgi:nitrite reductase (NADH) small subunit
MRTSDILTPPLSLQQKDMPAARSSEQEGLEDAPASAERQWTRVGLLDEIPRLGARVVRRAHGPNVAVFRTATDKVFALADRCPHRGGPLSQGIVFGERVACPLHSTCVDLDSGCAVAPDKGQVPVFAVKVENGQIYVDLPAG